MFKASIAGIYSLLLLSMFAPPALCQQPVGPARPAAIVPQIAPTVQNWTRSGKVLMVVDTIASLWPTQFPSSRPQAVDPSTVDLTTPEGVATAHNYESTWFGNVMAIAPVTMTVLNTDPNLFDLPTPQLAAALPFPYFLDSLTEQQLDLLASSGLGMSDLTSDQQALFQELIPDPLNLISSDAQLPFPTGIDPHQTDKERADKMAQFESEVDSYKKQIVGLPESQIIDQIRLHAYLNQTFTFDDDSGTNHRLSLKYLDPTSTGTMKIAPQLTTPAPAPGAARLVNLLNTRQTNMLKSGDLDWNMRALAVSVPVTNLMTVADLVKQLAGSTKLELYADASFENDGVYIGGDITKPQPASSLMQALALCVCGAWRKVGPIYVLTDDVVGIGPRQQFLSDVVSVWNGRASDAIGKADSHLSSYGWQLRLPNFPTDPDDLPSAAIGPLCKANGGTEATMSWSDLPVSLQNKLIATAANVHDRMSGSAYGGQSPNITVKPDTIVKDDLGISLALELQSDGIMMWTDINGLDSAANDAGAPISVTRIVLPEKLRAVICAPKSQSEAVKIVDMLPALGLNTLIVDVFNNGRTYFPCTSILPSTSDASRVLGAATAEGALKHIAIYAAVDLLCWRKDGSSNKRAEWPSRTILQDVDLFGEPSDVTARRREADGAITGRAIPGYGPLIEDEIDESWVSPLDESVQTSLPLMIRELAEAPGLSGIVFQDTAPPGYGQAPGFEEDQIGLGFDLKNRIQSLRDSHVDPVDIETKFFAMLFMSGTDEDVIFKFDIPGHNYLNHDIRWVDERPESDLALLKACFDAASSANPHLPLLMKERANEATIDPWRSAAMVDDHANAEEDQFSYIDRYSILDIPTLAMFNDSESLSGSVTNFRKAHGGGKAGGIAFDLEAGGIDEDPVKLLGKLQPYLNSH